MSTAPAPDPSALDRSAPARATPARGTASPAAPDLHWLDPAAPPYDAVYALVVEMATVQAAVGWLTVPPRTEIVVWLDGVLTGGARMVSALDPQGRLVGLGYWARQQAAVLTHSAELRKVMVHPAAQGRGVGRAVVAALVEDATLAGVELLLLDVRGNNHGALRLYASLGFVVSGRRPDLIAVGAERFDQVLMHRELQRPAGLLRHGGRRAGPGRT